MNGCNGFHKHISGGQLLDRMTSCDCVPETQIAFFIRQLLQALEHMHNKNIVHLDLRPENIMLSDKGTEQIKLTDFGLSRRLRRDKNTFGALGSPEFVAPEIVQQRPVSLSTDMWSVGVLAYVMLIGISPFHGDSDTETLQNVVNVKYSLDKDRFANVSSEAKDFISKLLVFDQNKRLSASGALLHPWMQISHEKRDKAQLLTTHFLKEFNYRHKWVERRVFVQYGPDDDQDYHYKPFPDLEPFYVPLLAPRTSRPSDQPFVTATLPLRLPPSYLSPNSYSRHNRVPGQEPLLAPALAGISYTTEEFLAADRLLLSGEHRSIEEELANRVLSDISEEGSVVSEDVGGYIRFTDQLAMENDAEPLTPIPESVSATSSIRRPLKIDIDDVTLKGTILSPIGVHVGSKGQKSPVILSPKMERTMSCKGVVTSPKNSPLQSPIPRQAVGNKQHNNGGKDGPVVKNGQKVDNNKLDLLSPNFIGDQRKQPGGQQEIEGLGRPPRELECFDGLGRPHRGPLDFEARGRQPGENGHHRFGDPRMPPGGPQQYPEDLRKQPWPGGPVPPPYSLGDPRMQPGYGRPFLPTSFDFSRRLLPPISPVDFSTKDRTIREVENYDWDTEYQMGPETFLMQHRDPDFVARIRDYRRRLFGDSCAMLDAGPLGEWNRDVSVRERRRYTDFLKSDKDAQRMIRVLDQDMQAMKTGACKRARSLQILPAPLPGPDGSCAPIFHTRLHDMVFGLNGDITFQCTVVGQPKPQVCWFHNEAIIVEDPRHVTALDESGKASLVIISAQLADAGLYKCVATNDNGQTSCVARLKVGEYAARCARPDVMLASDTEVFITWEAPQPVGGLSICAYKLEYRTSGDHDFSRPWVVISDNLDEEASVVKHLEALGIYQFRITAKNAFGWGEPSPASRIIQTHNKSAPKLNLDLLKKDYHFNIVCLPQSGALGDIMEEDAAYSESSTLVQEVGANNVPSSERRESKFNLELNTKDDPNGRYQLDSEIFRGRFCLIRNAVDLRCEAKAHCVAKICMASPDYRDNAVREYEILKETQHSNIVQLLNAYLRKDFLLLFLEKLHEDLLDRFTYSDYYTEDHITRVLEQLLSALQWIHFRRICYLDLRPDNIMFLNKRVWVAKLCDTGSALRLPSDSLEAKIPPGHLELAYSAPEILQLETVSTATDIWGLGIITFLLLSGTHPFPADCDTNDEELKKNIIGEKCDINYIFTNASQEALRFVTWCIKKQPANRMNTEEGLQHKWLSLLDISIKRRENIKFSANRLRQFSQSYKSRRLQKATNNNQLLTEYGQSQ